MLSPWWALLGLKVEGFRPQDLGLVLGVSVRAIVKALGSRVVNLAHGLWSLGFR